MKVSQALPMCLDSMLLHQPVSSVQGWSVHSKMVIFTASVENTVCVIAALVFALAMLATQDIPVTSAEKRIICQVGCVILSSSARTNALVVARATMKLEIASACPIEQALVVSSECVKPCLILYVGNALQKHASDAMIASLLEQMVDAYHARSMIQGARSVIAISAWPAAIFCSLL
jgi:hypothetical protein